MNENIKNDKEEACKKISSIISLLCDKYNLTPLFLCLGETPNYQKGGRLWNGSVHLTLGV
jgi:hypothetical protein